jgi:hypothetical protein
VRREENDALKTGLHLTAGFMKTYCATSAPLVASKKTDCPSPFSGASAPRCPPVSIEGSMPVQPRSAYAKWIAENRPADPWGQCEALTRLMATAFPELRRVRGHYGCPVQGRLPHWWMVTLDGQIVDPTQDQFASKGAGSYEEYEGREPTGTCIRRHSGSFRTGSQMHRLVV